MIPINRADLRMTLQADILRLQGFKSVNSSLLDVGLGVLRNSFPNASFPLGCMHEFLLAKPEDAAATSGFVAGLLTSLMGNNGSLIWISAFRKLFPPALKSFGIEPDRLIFIDLQKEKDVLWAMDEALKCGSLTAVIGEMKEISFTSSRRLQLAAEQSQVTGFILRHNSRNPNPTACVSRWKITSLKSEPIDDLPGVGYSKWNVQLLRVKNGKPGAWEIQWMNGRFIPIYKFTEIEERKKKTG
jgi:protein ImuA